MRWTLVWRSDYCGKIHSIESRLWVLLHTPGEECVGVQHPTGRLLLALGAPGGECLQLWIQSCHSSEWLSGLWGPSLKPGEVWAWVCYPTDRLLSAVDTPGGEYLQLCVQSCCIPCTVVSDKWHVCVLFRVTLLSLCHCMKTSIFELFNWGVRKCYCCCTLNYHLLPPPPYFDMSGAVVTLDATWKSPQVPGYIYSLWLFKE